MGAYSWIIGEGREQGRWNGRRGGNGRGGKGREKEGRGEKGRKGIVIQWYVAPYTDNTEWYVALMLAAGVWGGVSGA